MSTSLIPAECFVMPTLQTKARLYSVALASAEGIEVLILVGRRAGILNPYSVSLSCHGEVDEKAS